MFDLDLIRRTPWHDLLGFFASGSPPLIYQLLALNTVFFIIYCFRVSRAKHTMRASAAYAVQFLLMAANAALMFQKQLNISTLWLKDANQNVQAFVSGLIG